MNPPKLEEVKRLSRGQLGSYPASARLFRCMDFLGFEIYASETDESWWLGSADPALHAHERWFFRIPGDEAQANQSFKDLKVEMLDTCQRSYDTTLNDEMQALYTWVVSSEDPAFDEETEKHIRLPQERLILQLGLFAEFGYLSAANAKRLKTDRLTWRPELHDLLYHADDYSQLHPETGGLPRDILLRMYGLGGYVDYANEGYELITPE